jgi:hypothetical protein
MKRLLETLKHLPFFRSLTDAGACHLDMQCFWRRYEVKQLLTQPRPTGAATPGPVLRV